MDMDSDMGEDDMGMVNFSKRSNPYPSSSRLGRSQKVARVRGVKDGRFVRIGERSQKR
jgi:hypothetical protein